LLLLALLMMSRAGVTVMDLGLNLKRLES